MNPNVFVLMALCIVMSVGPVMADGLERPQAEFEIGLEEFFHHYEEPGIMEEEGWFTGIYGEGKFRTSENTSMTGIVKLQGSFAYGQVDYTSVNTGDLNDVDDFIVELRPLVGIEILTAKAFEITPYIGLGYRYWYDDLRGTSTTGATGYQRESQYFYLPVGIELAKNYRGWGWKLTLEGDYLLEGKQTTHLSDVHPALDDLENTQEEGYGARAGLAFTKYGDRIDFTVEPFVRYWDIDDSNFTSVTSFGTPIGDVGYEPANETLQTGIRLGMKF